MVAKRTKEGAHIERVAMALLGSPASSDIEKTTHRFGDFAVNYVTGKFYDFDAEDFGDAAELVRRVKQLENGAAEKWIDDNVLKAPPSELSPDLEYERQLIGLLSYKPNLVAMIEEEVSASDFTHKVHAKLFGAFLSEHLSDKPMSIGAMLDVCGGDPLLPVFGGRTLIQYIASITAAASYDEDLGDVARRLARAVRVGAEQERGEFDERENDPGVVPWQPRYRGVRFENLDQYGEEHSYTIDDWMTEGGKMVVGGASLSGKSFLAIHMAMCLATGTPFFGNRVLLPGLVVYQAGEGETGIRKRFRAWRQYFGINPAEKLPIYIIEQKVDLFNPNADTDMLINEIREISKTYNVPLRSIVFDTLAKASIGADENSGRDMGLVMSNIDRIALEFPRSNVTLVHHMNAGGTKLRGHTSVYANVDQVVLVTKEEGSKVRTATLDKQKDGESGLQIKFGLHVVEVGKRQIDGRPITSCVTLSDGGTATVSVAGDGAKKDRTMMLSAEETLIYQALKNAIDEHGEPPPATLKLPKSIKAVVKVRDWKAAYVAKTHDEKDNTINARMKRVSARFQNMRIIGRINPYVWVTNRDVAQAPAPDQGNIDAGPPVQQEFPDDPLDFSPR